jgi:hypothetical protein
MLSHGDRQLAVFLVAVYLAATKSGWWLLLLLLL